VTGVQTCALPIRPLKKKPSQTAQADTPNPLYFSSEGNPNHFAVAPVAIITVSAETHVEPSISTLCTPPSFENSTFVAYPNRTSVPKRSAWAFRSSIITGPVIPCG